MIDAENPDIIMGCESKLDNTHKNAEIFPERFHGQIFRRDLRKGSGGVLIAVKNDLLATEVKSQSKQAEVIWAKIHLRRPIYIASFYRNPGSGEGELIEFRNGIEDIMTSTRNPPNIIIGGDFNLPDIVWQTNTIGEKPPYPRVYSEQLLDTLGDLNFYQHVREPTHKLGNTLDLICSTNQDQVENHETNPGMSDYFGLIYEIRSEPHMNKKQPRKVYVYKKANESSIKEQLVHLNITFFDNWSNRTVNEN